MSSFPICGSVTIPGSYTMAYGGQATIGGGSTNMVAGVNSNNGQLLIGNTNTTNVVSGSYADYFRGNGSNTISIGSVGADKILENNEVYVGNKTSYIDITNDIIIKCGTKQVSILDLFNKLEMLEEENNEIRKVLNDVIDYTPGGTKYDTTKNDFNLKLEKLV